MPMMSVQQVAEYLDCEPKTVEEALRIKRLPGVKYGRSWRIPLSALDEALHAEAMAARRSLSPQAHSVGAAVNQRSRRSVLPALPSLSS
jgi:excisionase family DNA binding protein